MALSSRLLIRNLFFANNLIKTGPVRGFVNKQYPLRTVASGICYQNGGIGRYPVVRQIDVLPKWYSQSSAQGAQGPGGTEKLPDPPKKPGLVQRFKEMYRDYWYVLLPVHMTTSAIWFGGFYYAVSCGLDVVSLMESLGVSEKLLTPLRESSAGYYALAFALYKLVTPLRYAVTVGATTFAIKRLTVIGWIRPVPSRERLKEILQERKDNLQDRFNESKQHYQTQINEKKSQVMDEMRRYKKEMRKMKNRVKKM